MSERKDLVCKGYRIVPYGVDGSGTVPCEHRQGEYGPRLCPDADRKKIAAVNAKIDAHLAAHKETQR